MNDILKQLENELREAGMPMSEIQDILKIIVVMEEEDQASLVDLFKSDPAWAEKLSELLRSKKELLASGDTAGWDQLVSEEERMIEGLLEK